MTALVQLATRKAAFLIDPFSCFRKIQTKLRNLMQNRSVLKLMFGMGNDCKQFQKDFDIFPVVIMDVQHLFNEYRGDRSNLVGLTSVCQQLLPEYASLKSCTLSDWRRRPLTSDMVSYAAGDVIILFEIWDKLRSSMVRKINHN